MRRFWGFVLIIVLAGSGIIAGPTAAQVGEMPPASLRIGRESQPGVAIWPGRAATSYAAQLAPARGPFGNFPEVPPTFNLNLVDQHGGMLGPMVATSEYVYMSMGTRLAVLSAANPTRLALLGRTQALPDSISRIVVRGNYAYLALNLGGVMIVDVSEPTAPVIISQYKTESYIRNLDVQDNFLYVIDDRGMYIFDVSTPTTLIPEQFYDTPHELLDIVVDGSLAYLIEAQSGLHIVNISNPLEPQELGRWPTSRPLQNILLHDSYAYLRDERGYLHVVDVGDPARPERVHQFWAKFNKGRMSVIDHYLVVPQSLDIAVFDIGDPTDVQYVGRFEYSGFGIGDTAVSGNYLLLNTPLDVVTFDPGALPTLIPIGHYLSFVGIGTDVFYAGGYGHVVEPYVWQIFDVNDPDAPQLVARLPISSFSRVVATDELVFIGSDGGVDIGLLTGNEEPYFEWQAWIESPFWLGYLVDMDVKDHVLYVLYYNYEFPQPEYYFTRLVLYDVSDPANPELISFFDGLDYRLDIHQDHAYLYEHSGWWKIFDLSDPAAPEGVGGYPVPSSEVAFGDRYAYIFHGGWRSYYVTLLDLQVPSEPVWVAQHVLPTYVKDAVVVGETVFLGEPGGVRVLDFSDKQSPAQVGFYPLLRTEAFAKVGPRLYVASWKEGLAIFDFDESAIHTVSGMVVDHLGAPLHNVPISTEEGHEVRTRPDGSYTLRGMAPGDYQVQANRGLFFEPATHPLTVPPQQVGQNFTRIPLYFAYFPLVRQQ